MRAASAISVSAPSKIGAHPDVGSHRAILICAVCLTAPVGAAAKTRLAPCPDAPTAMCGAVVVPLDRANPAIGTIPISYRVARHTGKGPAKAPIFITEGGPGYSVTQNN